MLEKQPQSEVFHDSEVTMEVKFQKQAETKYKFGFRIHQMVYIRFMPTKSF